MTAGCSVASYPGSDVLGHASSNGLWEHSKKYVHDDHLGSAHLVTDRDSAVESRVMFGPWGTARDGNLWDLPLSEIALDELPVGFTGPSAGARRGDHQHARAGGPVAVLLHDVEVALVVDVGEAEAARGDGDVLEPVEQIAVLRPGCLG